MAALLEVETHLETKPASQGSANEFAPAPLFVKNRDGRIFATTNGNNEMGARVAKEERHKRPDSWPKRVAKTVDSANGGINLKNGMRREAPGKKTKRKQETRSRE